MTDVEAPEEPQAAEASLAAHGVGGIRDYPLMCPEGPDLEYVVGLLSFPSGAAEGDTASCEIVSLTEQEGRVLVAVPGAVWHKRPMKRVIPRTALWKASCIEVAATGADDRHSDTAVCNIKVWVGYLDPSLEASVDYVSIGADHPFGHDERGLPLVPHGQALATAVNEVFAFHSAAEAPHDAGIAQIGDRVANLEDALGKIAAGFKVIMEREAGNPGAGLPPATGAAVLKARAKPKPAAPPTKPGPNLLNLDPGVAQAAQEAEVSLAALAEMDRLVGTAPRGGRGDEPVILRQARHWGFRSPKTMAHPRLRLQRRTCRKPVELGPEPF